MGHEAKDCQGPAKTILEVNQSVVSSTSIRVGCISVQDVGVEAAGALRLLRDHGECLEPDKVLFLRRAHLAEVAHPSISEEPEIARPDLSRAGGGDLPGLPDRWGSTTRRGRPMLAGNGSRVESRCRSNACVVRVAGRGAG